MTSRPFDNEDLDTLRDTAQKLGVPDAARMARDELVSALGSSSGTEVSTPSSKQAAIHDTDVAAPERPSGSETA